MKQLLFIKENLRRKIMTKKRGDKTVLVELGLAVVGVALLVIFRDGISGLITTVVGNVTTWITELFS